MKNQISTPKHLSKEAKQIWRRLVDEYGINDAGGTEILRTGLEAFDRAQAARASIDKTGLLIKDRFGAIKPHPLIACERDARAAYLSALKQLQLDVEPLRDRPGRPNGRR